MRISFIYEERNGAGKDIKRMLAFAVEKTTLLYFLRNTIGLPDSTLGSPYIRCRLSTLSGVEDNDEMLLSQDVGPLVGKRVHIKFGDTLMYALEINHD